MIINAICSVCQYKKTLNMDFLWKTPTPQWSKCYNDYHGY